MNIIADKDYEAGDPFILKDKMTKQELIKEIEKNAISLPKFFRWIGYTDCREISAKVYQFKKTEFVDMKMIKLLECYKIEAKNEICYDFYK